MAKPMPLFRVRRHGAGGAVTEVRVDKLAKAVRVARQVHRRTGQRVQVERYVGHGWETALELAPQLEGR